MLKSITAFIYPVQTVPTRVIATSRWLGLSAVIIVLDQLSKLAIINYFQQGDTLALIEFFNLVRAHNTGAAFSFLSDAGGWQRWMFSAIALTAALWIVRLLRQHGQQTLFCLALALVLGGALGNLIDRVAYGYVVDFLDFYWDGYHFPAFNVADSVISVGAALLLLDSFRKK